MTAPFSSLVGSVVGGSYRVLGTLGESAAAHVYKALDLHLKHDVLIKVPRPSFLHDGAFTERFRKHVQNLLRVEHPHLVQVLDVGEHDGLPFLVLRFLSGGNLGQRNRKRGENGKNSRAESLRPWLEQVAAAADFMHERGFVHGDIRPENILFDERGEGFLSDFGLADEASVGQSGRALATVTPMNPNYAAPEVLAGKPCDGRADQFALAAVVFEQLTGKRPFDGQSASSVLLKQTRSELGPTADSLSAELADVLRRAMLPNPAERFDSCTAMAQAVLKHAAAPVRQAAVAALERVVACVVCGKSLRLQAASPPGRYRCPTCTPRENRDPDGDSEALRMENRNGRSRQRPEETVAAAGPPDRTPMFIALALIATVVLALGVLAFILLSPRPDARKHAEHAANRQSGNGGGSAVGEVGGRGDDMPPVREQFRQIQKTIDEEPLSIPQANKGQPAKEADPSTERARDEKSEPEKKTPEKSAEAAAKAGQQAAAVKAAAPPLAMAKPAEPPRNPFGVEDVPTPIDDAVRALALLKPTWNTYSKGSKDENAKEWGRKVTGDKNSIEGEWSARFYDDRDRGAAVGGHANWKDGIAKVKVANGKVFILFEQGGLTFITETVRASDKRLVGKVYCIDNKDWHPWLGEIVTGERIDGVWGQAPFGRFDLRRKFEAAK